MSLLSLLPTQKRRGHGFPPDVEGVVTERWTVAVLTHNGLDVARIRARGIDVKTLVGCVSLQLIDVEPLRGDAIDQLDPAEFNLQLLQIARTSPAMSQHPDDLLAQCYHDSGESDCGCCR